MYDAERAKAHCEHVVHVPVSTRWGSAADCEADVSSASPAEYLKVFEEVTKKAHSENMNLPTLTI